jgi:ubiquinone/menaquinone biosynthesis C-methylase UbiE
MNAPWSELSSPQTNGLKRGRSHRYWTEFWIQHGLASKDQDPDLRVLRTYQGQPLSPETTQDIVSHTLQLLQLHSNANVLDLACGTGLFAVPIADRCRAVTAVDVSTELLATLTVKAIPNLETIVGDIRDYAFPENTFDRVLLYAAIQYLEHTEVIELMKKIACGLKPQGILLIGDIPDATHRWQFFNSPKRRADYFRNLAAGTPIIGTWFEPDWLAYAGESVGFVRNIFHPQPETFPYAHFRFDMQFVRS